MTFSANVPNAGQSPGLFPAQMNTDLTRLKEIINAEHVFNDTKPTPSTSDTDGVHRQVTTINRADPITLIDDTNAILYTKAVDGTSQLFFYNGASIQQVTPFAQVVKAMVNFNGTGATGFKTMRSSIGVASVDKTATGLYTINFTPNLADDNYVVVFGGMRAASGDVVYGMVQGNSTYSNSVTNAFIKVEFAGNDGDPRDVLMGSVAILSTL